MNAASWPRNLWSLGSANLARLRERRRNSCPRSRRHRHVDDDIITNQSAKSSQNPKIERILIKKTQNIMKNTSIQEVKCGSKGMLLGFVPLNGTAPVLSCFLLAAALAFSRQVATAGEAPVNLGSAATFGVLAATTVTSTGATMVDGDIGVSPGTTVSGAPTMTGMLHLGDPIAAQAQLDLTTAYNDAAGRTVAAITVAGNLGGQTLAPGLYKSTSSLEISSGDLTLDAQGDANAVFIFQMGSTLTTTAGRQVILSGGARAANIYWQVGSSATLGTTSV